MKRKCIDCMEKLYKKLTESESGYDKSYGIVVRQNLYNDAWKTLDEIGFSKEAFEENLSDGYVGGNPDGEDEHIDFNIKLFGTMQVLHTAIDDYYTEDE